MKALMLAPCFFSVIEKSSKVGNLKAVTLVFYTFCLNLNKR